MPCKPIRYTAMCTHLSGSLQENAAVLLGRQHKELEWHNRMAPYWKSLPRGNGSILCRHLFTEQEAAMLQSDDMVCSMCALPSIVAGHSEDLN